MMPLPPDLSVAHTEYGTLLSSRIPLSPPARCVGDWLVAHARSRPDALFLAERGADGAWQRHTYAEVLRAVEGVASALLDSGARTDRPVMVLSDNSVAAAIVILACLHVGVPVSPVSSAWSRLSSTHGRLREVAELLRPAVVFADDPAVYGAAAAAVGAATTWWSADLPALAATPRSPKLSPVFAGLGPSTVAKVLFTSGSTGAPRGVVNTQRMLTSNQASLAAIWPFLDEEPPVVVDWLPWSHTFGGNHNFFLVLRSGGELWIDGGRPVPGLVETTVRNLADVSPTLWFNVPRGFDQVLPLLEADEALAERVFRRLGLLFYAAAALAPTTRARLEAVATRAGRPDVFFTSSWGSTETAPLATSAHFPTRTVGVLGVPVPGVELLLAPVQDRLELRVRGPNVSPGTWTRGAVVEPLALDEHGFLPTGDAGRLADEGDPAQGVVFAGRISENFKLSSGTWVSVGHVRLALVDACAPLLLDAVIAGHDREALGALLFPSPAGRALPPEVLRERLREGLAAHATKHPGSSERIAVARVSEAPLSLDAGETTDKGYTNQRRVLELRADEVAALFVDDGANLHP
ncbi:MAG: AMP-binding protein [Alphaproteobacteria bacterium]|nr:AMP-binding protein [Alphaproteobacteria bacterium]